jgi:anti-sigma factor RsiW
MSPGQLEFAITQYLDGTLPPEQWDAVRNRLGSDPQAQAYLAEHEKLTALLRSQTLPDLDWAEVARDLSAMVTGSVDEASRAEDQKLNAILKAATPLPAVRWDELSKRIGAAIDTSFA